MSCRRSQFGLIVRERVRAQVASMMDVRTDHVLDLPSLGLVRFLVVATDDDVLSRPTLDDARSSEIRAPRYTSPWGPRTA
jgi:hypothetical protein